MEEGQSEFREHPIQLRVFGVRELHIAANVPPSPDIASTQECDVRIGRTEYDKKRHSVFVTVEAVIPETEALEADDPKQPFFLKVAVAGYFEVDEARFPVEYVDHWADNNAFYILYPFVREHVFALTARAGFKPMILPLLEIPTIPPSQGNAHEQREE